MLGMYFAKAPLYLLWKNCPSVQVCDAQIGTEEGAKRDIFAYLAVKRVPNCNEFSASNLSCARRGAVL